jgi:hypothetical protein
LAASAAAEASAAEQQKKGAAAAASAVVSSEYSYESEEEATPAAAAQAKQEPAGKAACSKVAAKALACRASAAALVPVQPKAAAAAPAMQVAVLADEPGRGAKRRRHRRATSASTYTASSSSSRAKDERSREARRKPRRKHRRHRKCEHENPKQPDEARPPRKKEKAEGPLQHGTHERGQGQPQHQEQRGRTERGGRADGSLGCGSSGQRQTPSRLQGYAGSETDQDYRNFEVAASGFCRGDGILLRRTMDMRDVDPDYCVYWGRKIRARKAGEGWLQMAAGGYLPMAIDGVLLVWPVGTGPGQAASRQAGSGSQLRGQGRQQQEEHRARTDRRVYVGGSPGCGSSGQRRQPLKADPVQEGSSQAGAGSKWHGQGRRQHEEHRAKTDRRVYENGSPGCGSSGQRRLPCRADTIQEEGSRAGNGRELREPRRPQDKEHREEEDRRGREGRSPGCESYGQRRLPLGADPIQEGTRQASTRSKLPVQDQLHHGEHREEEERRGHADGSSLCGSLGQHRLPEGNIEGSSRKGESVCRGVLARQRPPMSKADGAGSGARREESEQPQPREQHRPPLARRIRRAGEKPVGEGSPRGQRMPAEEPAAWAESQGLRARETPGKKSQWKKKGAPQPTPPAAQQQGGEGTISQWKKGNAKKQSQKRRNNQARAGRRRVLVAKWAKGGQQHEWDGAGLEPAQSPESDTSGRSRRPWDEAGREPAQSPEPDTRGRSRRPRDTRSQEDSRSRSARRSPRR